MVGNKTVMLYFKMIKKINKQIIKINNLIYYINKIIIIIMIIIIIIIVWALCLSFFLLKGVNREMHLSMFTYQLHGIHFVCLR